MVIATTHAAPGRPRDELREQAILDATISLLMEVGYERLSIDSLAARAHSSKATIYRRWSGKAEVAAEAIRRYIASMDSMGFGDDAGSLHADLLAAARAFGTFITSKAGGMIAGLMMAMRTDEELGRLIRDDVIDGPCTALASIVARAVHRGELAPGADPSPVVEVLPALILTRSLIGGLPLDETYYRHLVDTVVAPLLVTRPAPDDPSSSGHSVIPAHRPPSEDR